MDFDRAKFKELVLFVADKSVDDPSFGATKLNKVLFFSDFLAYAELGQPITGADYQKLKYGPAPRPLLPIQRRLQDEGSAAIVPQRLGNFAQRRLMALRPPNLALFSADEIALVDEVIETLRGATAVHASQLSHRWGVGWTVAGEGDTIPYESVFWDVPQLLPEDVERGQDVAIKLGLTTTA